MSLKILQEDNGSKILIITPLFTGHKISGETKTTIKRNKISYTWVSYMSEMKHAANVQKGLNSYRKKTGSITPPYVMVLDRDIILSRHAIDKMFDVIEKSDKNVGWVYCPFEYKGHINISFPAQEFDINKLLKGNYISSNSLYKTSMIDRVGGFVTETEMNRLSDWAMWLKCYKFGYIGKVCPQASFIAISTKDDISAGSSNEYSTTKELVVERYIKPLMDQMKGS